ncbi:MAG: MBOAT family protein, partial [Hungatella sp.]
VLVFLGWVLFAHDDLAAGLTYYKQMFGLGQLALFSTRTGYLLLSYLPLLAMSVIGSTGGPKCMAEKLLYREKSGAEVSTVSVIVRMFGMALLLLLVVAYLVDAGYNPFLYFRF